MIISQLNDSLCFKEVIIGDFIFVFIFLVVKINTFECKVLYIFLKKVRITEGRTTLTAPEQSFETMLSQCLTFITLDNLESTVLPGLQSSGRVHPSLPRRRPPPSLREQHCRVGAC